MHYAIPRFCTRLHADIASTEHCHCSPFFEPFRALTTDETAGKDVESDDMRYSGWRAALLYAARKCTSERGTPGPDRDTNSTACGVVQASERIQRKQSRRLWSI